MFPIIISVSSGHTWRWIDNTLSGIFNIALKPMMTYFSWSVTTLTYEEQFIANLRSRRNTVIDTVCGYITLELKTNSIGQEVLGMVNEQGAVAIINTPWEQYLTQYLESIKDKIQYVEPGELSDTWSEPNFVVFRKALTTKGLITEVTTCIDLNDVEIKRHVLFCGEDKNLALDLYIKWINRYGEPVEEPREEAHPIRNLLIGGLAISGAILGSSLARKGLELSFSRESLAKFDWHRLGCGINLGLNALAMITNQDTNAFLIGFSALSCAELTTAQAVWQSPTALGSLNGATGFILNGEAANDQGGYSVSLAGDINGDKFADLIIGAPYASPDGNYNAGRSYVVFGHNGIWNKVLNLTSLRGINGFMLDSGEAMVQNSYSVSLAGDVNGDKFADLIIGAPYASPEGVVGAFWSGQSYVVFGHNDTWVKIVNLTSLNGMNGFILNDEDYYDQSGWSVSQAGDINGDKFDDLMVGAPFASPDENYNAGRSYVVFGHNGTWDKIVNLTSLNGINGFILDGETYSDGSGSSVSSAGDINGDQFQDLIIGAPYALSSAGRSYVVFGHDGIWDGIVNLTGLNGLNGFILDGEAAGDQSGWSVSQAGDINGDKVDDLIIGAPKASPAWNYNAGRSYVVFGHYGIWDGIVNITSLNGINGFMLDGETYGDNSGFSVSQAGDINGDNFDDLIIGAPFVSPRGSITVAGRSYVVFGHNGTWNRVFNLAILNGINGFMLDGETYGDNSGFSVNQAGDINGDEIADFIIGAPLALTSAGRSYVIFGQHTSAFKIGTLLSSQVGCCTAYIGQPYNFTFTSGSFIAVNPSAITYDVITVSNSSTTVPNWLNFNPAIKTFSGLPTNATCIGTLDLKVIANYGLLSGVSQNFTLNIIGTLSATNITQVIHYLENTDYNLAAIAISTPSSTITARLTLSDATTGKFTVDTRDGVASSYNPTTGTWQAAGNIVGVNALLADLRFQPTANLYKGFTVEVVITDSYGQSLYSTINAMGEANTATKNSAQLIGGIIGGVLGATAVVGIGTGIAIYKYRQKYEAAEAELGVDLTELRSWGFELSLKPPRNTVEHYKLIPAGDIDLRKVVEAYQRSAVPNMDIKSVEIIYSPNLEQAFNTRIKILQEKAGNPAFTPKWTQNGQLELRGAIMDYLEQIVAPYKEEQYNAVKLLPVWYGAKRKALDNIFRVGYTPYEGSFGKGLYSAYEAKYAYKAYSQGALLVNWMSFFSAFPVINGDMDKLQDKGNYANYDAHFVPLHPAITALEEQSYYPCPQITEEMYHELVVFEAAQCLPRYLVHLQTNLPKAVSPALAAAPTLAMEADNEADSAKQAESQDAQVAPQASSVSLNTHGFFTNSASQERRIYRTAIAESLVAPQADTGNDLPLNPPTDLQRQKRQ